MAEVRLDPDATATDVKVQDDGRVYLTQKLAGKRVNVFAEVVGDDQEGADG